MGHKLALLRKPKIRYERDWRREVQPWSPTIWCRNRKHTRFERTGSWGVTRSAGGAARAGSQQLPR